MTTRFEAKIKLGNMKRAPLTHVGFRGRTLKKGDSFTTTNPEEAAYYLAQPGFSVTIKKGRLAAAKPAKVSEPEPEEVDDEESDDEDEEERDDEVDGAYEKADLKKLKVEELKTLINDDEDLPLSVDDLPKKAGKTEIIEAILEAQAGGGEEDEEDEDDDD